MKIADNNRIDPTLTEYIVVEGEPQFPEDVPVEGTREGDGVLTIGRLPPQTGSLAFLGPPGFAGSQLAIQEINDLGGVLGQPITYLPGDSGDTTTNQADQTVDRHLAENVDAIIGAASSSVTLTVIDKITAAGVTMFSPANTSTELSDYDDNGLYFRSAPPDLYQGDVLGQFVINEGNQSVAIMNLNDSYGNSLADQATTTIEASGGEVVERDRVRPGGDVVRQRGRPDSPRPTPTRSSSSASTSRRGSCGRWSSRASARGICPSMASTATSATPWVSTSTPAPDPARVAEQARAVGPGSAVSRSARPGPACPRYSSITRGSPTARGRCRCRRCDPGRGRTRGGRPGDSGGRSARPSGWPHRCR